MLGIFALGFRHGFDLDHVVAITDISGSQFRRLRAFVLSTLYALGHALTVVILGLGIAWAGWEVPDAGRLIGLTLVILGSYVLWCVATGRRPSSRAGLLTAGMRRVRGHLRPTTVVEHEHPHDHGGGDARHRHTHDGEPLELAPDPVARAVESGASSTEGEPRTAVPAAHAGHRHRHRHRHEDIPAPYGAAGAVGIGMIHGIGAETPTQILALAAGTVSLAPFLIGLFLANSVVAVVAVFGITERRLRGLNVVVGGFSLFVGIPYLLGMPVPGLG